MPEWICKKWLKEFGYDFCKELMIAFSKEPVLTLRPNTLKTDAKSLCDMLDVKADAIGSAVECEGFDIANDKLYLEGYYTVQDRAAMAAAIALEPKAGESIIDMCAAPGGKTTHIAELMQNKGQIKAFDIYDHKVELIKKNAKRLGITIIDVS